MELNRLAYYGKYYGANLSEAIFLSFHSYYLHNTSVLCSGYPCHEENVAVARSCHDDDDCQSIQS